MAKKLGKRATSLIVLAGAVVLLTGAYLLIRFLPKGGEAEATPSPAAEENVLYECDKDSITGFTLKSAGETWDVAVSKKDETVTNTDGTKTTQTNTVYTLTDYPDVPVNEETGGNVLTNFSKILTVGPVETETPEDLTPYGLDPPVVTGTVRLADGTGTEIYLGNKTGAGNTYYMMKQGDPAVYEVKLTYGDRLSYTREDIVKTDVVPTLSMDSVSHVLLKRTGQPDIEAQHQDVQEGQAQLGVSVFKMVKPFSLSRDVSGEEFDTFLTNIGSIKMTGIISLDPAQKAEYGLDEPRIELSAQDADNSLTLYFGDDYGDGQIACMVKGYTPIYFVDKASVEFLENAKAEDLADKFLLLPMIDDVDSVDITIGGATHTMSIQRTTEKATEEGQEDKVVETYFLDGVQKNEDEFKAVYQAAIGVTADAYTDDPALSQGDAIASVTYHFNVGDIPTMTVSFYAYDVDFYAGALDGETKALVAQRKVDAIKTAMDTLIQSEFAD